jgi:hypothetical protein
MSRRQPGHGFVTFVTLRVLRDSQRSDVIAVGQ